MLVVCVIDPESTCGIIFLPRTLLTATTIICRQFIRIFSCNLADVKSCCYGYKNGRKTSNDKHQAHMKKTTVSSLILAAGKGTRMKSDRAKVLHEVLDAPMIHYVLDAVQELSPAQTIVVVGHQGEEVKAAMAKYQVTFVLQKEQLGTGHAVLCAKDILQASGGTVLILCGDVPLIRPVTLRQMLAEHLGKSPVLTLMTTRLDKPAGYGRIISSDDGRIVKIVEEKDATAAEKEIKEVNAGIYCADIDILFDLLAEVDFNNSQGEMYLTDIVAVAIRHGLKVNRFSGADAVEVLGVNSMDELAEARELMRKRQQQP